MIEQVKQELEEDDLELADHQSIRVLAQSIVEKISAHFMVKQNASRQCMTVPTSTLVFLRSMHRPSQLGLKNNTLLRLPIIQLRLKF